MKFIGKTLFFSLVISLFLFITLQIDRIMQKPMILESQILGVSTDDSTFCRLISAVQDIYCKTTYIPSTTISPTIMLSNTAPQKIGDTSINSFVEAVQLFNVKGVSNSDGKSATITYETNIPTLTVIEYGTTPASLLLRAPESSQSTNHSIVLSPLKTGTNYYYRIRIGEKVYDNNGIPFSFKTISVDTSTNSFVEAVQLFNVLGSTSNDGRSATITYKTNIPTMGVIEYGTTPASLLLRAPENNQVINHSITLSPLKSGTNYYFRIRIGEKIYDNNGLPFSFKTYNPQ